MSNLTVEEFLSHHGIKGMRWGSRKEVHPDIAHIPKKTRKEAASDAEEFTKAKLFYGESAGTRRKLIKAKVESKKSKDKLYAKAFDHFVSKTDLGKRADQAKSARKRKDVKNYSKKTAKGVGHVVRGNNQYANTAAILGVGAASLILKKHMAQSGVDEILSHHGIKGMRWGRRKGTSSEPQPVHLRDKGKKIKTSGGGGHPAHPDAIDARIAGQVIKKSGTKALSNADLQKYANRLRLEQSIKPLTTNENPAAKKYVKSVISQSGSSAVSSVASRLATRAVNRALFSAVKETKKAASRHNVNKQRFGFS